MKKFVIKKLESLLKALSKSTIRKYKPFVIGITGSVGKTSTKRAVYNVLRDVGNVRMAGGNLNNELGMPLAILGDYKTSGGAFFWLGVIMKSFWGLVWKIKYPKILILEYGADRPGDMDYLLSIVRPDVAVVTAVGDIPVHVEFYNGPEAVAKEKSKLVKSLKPEGTAVLNIDDSFVKEMKDLWKGNVMTYGFSDEASLKVTNFVNRSEFGKPLGISFKLETSDNFVPVRIEEIFGKSQAYSASAAAACGLIKGMNLVKISEALGQYKGEPGRCRLVEGIKDTSIIDDTYNSSPLAVEAAIEVLKDLSAPRKVVVLGDMAELGKYTTYAHEEVGRQVYKACDVLITVGDKARFIAEGARKAGFSKKDIYSWNDVNEAKLEIQNILESHDLILVKGSQSMRMEKIVLEIMAEPAKAKELLVRQYGKWLAG